MRLHVIRGGRADHWLDVITGRLYEAMTHLPSDDTVVLPLQVLR